MEIDKNKVPIRNLLNVANLLATFPNEYDILYDIITNEECELNINYPLSTIKHFLTFRIENDVLKENITVLHEKGIVNYTSLGVTILKNIWI